VPMAQAIIFDLDNCLAPADAAGPELMAPMFAAIRQANRGLLSEATLERAFKECWRSSLDVVAAMHGFSEDMLAAAWHVGRRLEVRGPLEGYSDVPLLATLPAMLFLVTTGFRRLQASKIAALDLRDYFVDVQIDAIDEPGRRGKRDIFSSVLAEYALSAGEVLVVGDNPASEIEAGNALGLATAQILRPGVDRGVNAGHYVKGLGDVAALVRALWRGDTR